MTIQQPLTMLVGRNHNQTHSFDYCTFAELLERVQSPAQLQGADIKAIKESAPICAPHNAPVKTKDEVLAHNKFTMLWADLDEGDQDKEAIQALLTGFGIESYATYSTASSEPNNKRWRVLVELEEAVTFEKWRTLQSYLTYSLAGDAVALRPQQILYLPFECEQTQHFETAIGEGYPLDTMLSDFETKARDHQQEQEAKAAQEATQAPAKALQPSNAEGAGIIGKISEYFSHDLRGVLQQHQYKGNVGKMLRPNSSSGAPAVHLFDEGTPEVRCYSHHGADDPLSALNHGGHALDLPAVICALDFNNDTAAMVKHYAPLVDAEGQKQRLDEWRKKKAIEKNIFFSHGFIQNEAGDWVGDVSGEPPPAEVLKKVSQALERVIAPLEPIPNSWDLAADAKPARYLVDGILEEDAHGILGGASMTYKSFLVKRLAYSLCSGTPFAGREVYKAGAVVYVCGEGQGAINRRLKALLIKLGKPKHPIHVITSGVSLTCPDSMGRLLERIKPLKPVLVIFDTFASLSGGIEENSNSEVGEALNRVRDTCRVAGASSLIVHHFGKNAEQGFRGASAFTNNVDYALLAHRRGAEDSRELGLTCHKMKDGEHFKEIFFKADIVPLGIYDQKGKESTSLILEHDVNGVSNKPLTQNEIMLRELKHLQSVASITSTTDDPSWISWKDWSAAAKEYDVKNVSREKDKLIERGQVAENKGKFRAA